MQSCCLEGCESYKFSNKQKIGYYKFPVDNKPLLEKWLKQIRISNWIPDDSHQICSTHFHVDDIDFNGKHPRLKENAVPVIFPLKHFQNIYVDELASMGQEQKKINDPKSLKKQAIACKKKMDLIDSKNTSSPGQKSMMLLCAPTQQLKSPRIQINSKNQSNNIGVRNIPLKANQNCQPALNPCILIVSENSESKIAFTKPQKSKQAVLRIQIEKKVNDIPCDFVIDSTAKRKTKELNQLNIKNAENNIENNGFEEIEVNDVTSTKKVIFKFDPSTGEITVEKKDILTNQAIDNNEKNFDTKKINSSTNNNAKENNENIQTPSEDSTKIQEEAISKEKSSSKNPNLESEISNVDENIAKNILTSSASVEQLKSTKEKETSVATTVLQNIVPKTMKEIVESQRITKEIQVSTASIESQATAKNSTEELQTSVTTVQPPQKLTIKPTTELQISTPNIESPNSVKEPEISTENGESQESVENPTKEVQSPTSTVELRKTPRRLAKESAILTTTGELKKPTSKPVQQTQTSVVESKISTKTPATVQSVSIPVVESKTPVKKSITEQSNSTSGIEIKIPVKKIATEQQPATPIVQLKTLENISSKKQLTPTIQLKPAGKTSPRAQISPTVTAESKNLDKQIIKTPLTQIRTVGGPVAPKSPIKKSQTLTPVVSLQRTINKTTQLQNNSIINKDTKTGNNNQITKVKTNEVNKKRKSDVIIINTSEDEDEKLSTNNKKLKPNSNTVIIHDQAVITIVE